MAIGDVADGANGWHSPRAYTPPMDGRECAGLTARTNASPSSSSSSRSSFLVEEQDDCGYTNHNTYEREPLLHGNDSYIHNYNGRIYKENGDSNYEGNDASGMVKLHLPSTVRRVPRFPNEIRKTLIAFGFLVFSVIFTALLHVLTHERVPSVPRLPDIIIDNTSTKNWGIISPDIPLMISIYSVIGVVLFHRHRFIIIRRLCFIMGLIYFYRAITFFVTVLPVPRSESHCLPKLNTTGVMPVLKRMVQIFSNFGMTNVIFCGDYIYSGHTACFVISYLIIKEYSPRRWWIVHYLYGIMGFVGVMMLIVFGNHYTIDCVIAYFITTRLFYLYHTLVHNQILKENGPTNYFERVWWFPFFQYLEKNVHGPVPRRFEWPFPWPRSWRSQSQ